MLCKIQETCTVLLFMATAVVLCNANQLEPDQSVALMNALPELTRFTFHNNVLRSFGTYDVKDWVVVFCPRGFEACDAIRPGFAMLGHKWEAKANNARLLSAMRFAYVNCATEKALCNEQGVKNYPWVVHYNKHKPVAFWTTDQVKDALLHLSEWLDGQLGQTVEALSFQDSGSHDEGAAEPGAILTSSLIDDVESKNAAAGLCLMVAVIAGTAWVITYDSGLLGEDNRSLPQQLGSLLTTLSSLLKTIGIE